MNTGSIPGPTGRTAHVDPFCREGLPPVSQWPTMHWDLPELAYPGQLNAGVTLLDEAVARRSWGERSCTAAADGSVSLSYGELLDWSDRIAAVLVEDLGLLPGNRVLLRCFNHPWAVAAWFAVIRAGGVVVTTMPLLRTSEIQTTVDKAEVSLALCDARLMAEMEGVTGDVTVVPWGTGGADDLLVRARSKPAGFTPVETAADDVALLAFTSGTTGEPKCTMHFHRDLLAIADMFNPVLDPRGDDVFCGSPPLAFTFGLGGLVVFPMRVGASTVLTERPGEEFLQAIEDHRPTVCFTAPTAYRAMMGARDQFDLTSLRAGVSAGETLPKPTWERFKEEMGIELIDGIGSTELLHIFISASGRDIRPGATGRPLLGVEARVVDEAMDPVADGEVGLLAVQAPTGCRYLQDERQTDYVKEGWNLTGDAYIKDEEGYFWYQARTDDMIISSGYNIAGPEVEASLLKHPAVAECAVIGVADEMRTQVVKAFVVPDPGVKADDDLATELQAFVKEDIAPYKYPRQVEFIAALPKTQTGKVQRYRLREVEESKL
ncbi:MAG TPA: AMP-binding protein [Acidimicrobiia bacterium]|nr:AMP-binding protein [Acidimicrobiia bacterium]